MTILAGFIPFELAEITTSIDIYIERMFRYCVYMEVDSDE